MARHAYEVSNRRRTAMIGAVVLGTTAALVAVYLALGAAGVFSRDTSPGKGTPVRLVPVPVSRTSTTSARP